MDRALTSLGPVAYRRAGQAGHDINLGATDEYDAAVRRFLRAADAVAEAQVGTTSRAATQWKSWGDVTFR